MDSFTSAIVPSGSMAETATEMLSLNENVAPFCGEVMEQVGVALLDEPLPPLSFGLFFVHPKMIARMLIRRIVLNFLILFVFICSPQSQRMLF